MASNTQETTSACIDSFGSAIGMPQLCSEWMGNQVFWLAITLVAIFFVLSRIALPRIAAVLAERQGTITNDLSAAEDLKAKAAAAEEVYQKALVDARAEASRIIEATRAEIKAELNKAMVKADEEISAKAAESEKAIAEIRDNAKASVEEVAKETAKEIVSALAEKVDARTINAAVNARMKG